jgi:hypothetical protein
MPPRLTITDVALSRAVDHDRSVSLEARTPDGRLVGTALARRAPMAIAYFEALDQGMPPVDYADELDRVAFLDHVEVAEAERRTPARPAASSPRPRSSSGAGFRCCRPASACPASSAAAGRCRTRPNRTTGCSRGCRGREAIQDET